MKREKYLLYIDILGFSHLARTDYSRIKELFNIINSLNAHKHPDFQTIVFSDTILVFNKIAAASTKEDEYIVNYACEFAQDLLFRSKDLNIHFRAILTYGEFDYEKLENIEAYHGIALIDAHEQEKNINGLWLYIDKNISKHLKWFTATTFDEGLDFVFLLQDIERVKQMGINEFPVAMELVDPYFTYDFREEIEILKNIKEKIDSEMDSKIRGKYLQTYYFFKTRYKEMVDFLELNDFDFRKISPESNWEL